MFFFIETFPNNDQNKSEAKRAPKRATNEDDVEENNEPDNFCHFYNNYRRCTFEENTGKQCKFVHRRAPVCDFDGQCGRSKCMFQHKNQSIGRDDFLGPKQKHFQPNRMNWGMNPWVPNPWMYQGKRGQMQ